MPPLSALETVRYHAGMPTTQKIRYSDCDPQGIVFNGNYPRYWDDAATDWLEDLGLGGPGLGGNGIEVVTARLEIDFKSSATLGDVLETSVQVAKFGTASMDVAIETVNEASRAVIATGKLVWVFVDPEHFRPVPAPQDIRKVLESGTSSI
ncbi:thioesterase family protein [soil metagenome]